MNRCILFLIVFVCLPAHADTPAGFPWKGVVIQTACSPGASANECVPGSVELVQEVIADGANMIMIDFHIQHFLAQNTTIGEEQAKVFQFNLVHQMLDECSTAGIPCLLRNHRWPIIGGQGYNQASPEFWQDEDLFEEYVSFIEEVMDAFSNRGPELVGYSFMPDAVANTPSGAIWPEEYQDLIELQVEIREKRDPGRWLTVGLGINAQPKTFDGAEPYDHDRLIYVVRGYQPFCYTHSSLGGRPRNRDNYPDSTTVKACYGGVQLNRQYITDTFAPVAAFAEQTEKPVWVDEFSAVRYVGGSDNYVADMIEEFNLNGFGWTYFMAGHVPGMWNYQDLTRIPSWWSNPQKFSFFQSGNTFSGRRTLLIDAWNN